MADWSFSWISKNLMKIAAMEENRNELIQRVWLELEKIYSGDRSQMRKAINYMSGYQNGLRPTFWETQKKLVKANYADWTPENFQKTIGICQDIKANWDKFTTELAPPPSPTPLKSESYNQLTLDFSETTELISQAPTQVCKEKSPLLQNESEGRSLTHFPNESIFLAISRQGTKKGWLTPQYKYKKESTNSTTTNWSVNGVGRVWGPYWVFCWPRHGYDGHYYLGKADGKKFQHFCEVWKSSHSLEEILRRLGLR